jgi:hypothetical protein
MFETNLLLEHAVRPFTSLLLSAGALRDFRVELGLYAYKNISSDPNDHAIAELRSDAIAALTAAMLR